MQITFYVHIHKVKKYMVIIRTQILFSTITKLIFQCQGNNVKPKCFEMMVHYIISMNIKSKKIK